MSASKRKGTAWESAVVDWLRAHGHPYCERRALNGSRDRGDITGIPNVVVEAKNTNRHDFAGAVDEARVEAANARVDIFVAVIKRKGKGDPGEAYAVTTLDVFNRLLLDDPVAIKVLADTIDDAFGDEAA
jgi:hypothetical protein